MASVAVEPGVFSATEVPESCEILFEEGVPEGLEYRLKML
jgi:hypothetical protein